jgi:antitoxin (DNA-binding transcriptional repressor) of toxin-antitoxin stability system
MLRGYIMAMSVVKVSELKNRLSHYLRLVRRGETVLVSDRDQVIARIEPAGDKASTGTDDAGWLGDLERRGVVRRGAGRLPRDWARRRPLVTVDVVGALLDERRDGR